MLCLKHTLLFLAALVLFSVVAPGNHSEAEDAFEYSRLIEEGGGAELFHPHHLLYLPAQKVVFRAIQVLGYSGRSYHVTRAVSMFSGALALCLFHLILCRLQSLARGSSSRQLPWIAMMGLLFSYGFVRYACEVEIYLPALVVALAAIHAALRARDSWGWFVACIVISTLAVLIHTINSAMALGVIPLFYLLVSGDRRQVIVHAMVTIFLVGLVYFIVQETWGISRPPVDTASEGLLRPGSLAKAAVGFGQCLLSANYIFAYDALAERLQTMFPYRVFAEELFAASHMPPWLKAVAPLTFVLAVAGMASIAVFLLFNTLRIRAFDRMLVVLLLWLGGTMFPTIVLEPSNPELWVLALVPLWAIFFWLAVRLDLSAKSVRLFGLVVVLLGIHNVVAGMGSVKDRDGDYHFRKAEWILRHAGDNDVVHTADSHVFMFYLNYLGKAEVRNVNSQDWKAGDATYVFDDVFNPPSAIGVRYPHFAERVATTAKELRPKCRKIHEDQFGGIWVVEAGGSK